MSDDVQVTVFLRPDTIIETFDRVPTTYPDLGRVAGVRIGDVTLHIWARDDRGLAALTTRLIDALGTLRLAALDRLNPPLEPPEPDWLHETDLCSDCGKPLDKCEYEIRAQKRRERVVPNGPFFLGWTEPERREAFGK